MKSLKSLHPTAKDIYESLILRNPESAKRYLAIQLGSKDKTEKFQLTLDNESKTLNRLS